MMPRVYVDFNTETSEPVGVLKIYQPEMPLSDGETIIAYDEEMEVQAKVTFDAASGLWLAVPDWTAKRDIIEQHA
jgi:type IV secretory pathway protease TraF